MPAWTAGSASARSGPPPPAELSVLNGTVQAYRGQPVPAGGCLGQAAAELSRAGIGSAAQQSGGHWPGSLASGLEHAAFDRAQSDARVRAVFAKWSACMRAHGYAYRTPFDAGSDPRWLARTAPSRAKILTAQRDLGCKLPVNLIGVEFAVISDYENLGMAQDPGAITAASTAVRSEAAAIKRAMARYGT